MSEELHIQMPWEDLGELASELAVRAEGDLLSVPSPSALSEGAWTRLFLSLADGSVAIEATARCNMVMDRGEAVAAEWRYELVFESVTPDTDHAHGVWSTVLQRRGVEPTLAADEVAPVDSGVFEEVDTGIVTEGSVADGVLETYAHDDAHAATSSGYDDDGAEMPTVVSDEAMHIPIADHANYVEAAPASFAPSAAPPRSIQPSAAPPRSIQPSAAPARSFHPSASPPRSIKPSAAPGTHEIKPLVQAQVANGPWTLLRPSMASGWRPSSDFVPEAVSPPPTGLFADRAALIGQAVEAPRPEGAQNLRRLEAAPRPGQPMPHIQSAAPTPSRHPSGGLEIVPDSQLDEPHWGDGETLQHSDLVVQDAAEDLADDGYIRDIAEPQHTDDSILTVENPVDEDDEY